MTLAIFILLAWFGGTILAACKLSAGAVCCGQRSRPRLSFDPLTRRLFTVNRILK